jgi:hypothetical protein
MGYIFQDSGQLYVSTADYVRRWSAVTGTPHTLTTTDARWPETQCIAYTGSQSGTLGKGFPVAGLSPASRFYWSCALRAAAPGGTGTSGAFLFGHDASSQDNQSNAHVQLRINPDGAVAILRGTTLLATSAAGVFPFLQWNRVELEIYVHASEGTCRVRVNGAVVIEFTGNTRNASYPEGIGYFSLRTASVGGTPGGGSYRFQDLLVWSGGDGMPNDFLGDFAIITRTPSANGATVDGATVGAASAHQAVQTQDGDASYQKLEQPGDFDLFQKASLDADQVFGMLVHAYVRADGPDVLPMKMLMRSNSATYEHAGDLAAPGQAQYVGREAFFAVDPATDEAWTPATLNAAEFGYKWVA